MFAPPLRISRPAAHDTRMVIYRGWGLAAFGIIFGCSLAANLICDAAAGDDGTYWKRHGWPFACAMFSAGAGIWVLDLVLTKRIAPGSRHHLFFIPLRWWGFLCGAIGLIVLVTGWSPGDR
jgi:hypothetical protein